MPTKNKFKGKKIPGLPRTRLNRIEAGLARELRAIMWRFVDDVIAKLKPYTAQEAFIPTINVDAVGQEYSTDLFATISRHKIRAIEVAGVYMANKFSVPFDKKYFNNQVVPLIMDRTFKIVTTQITKSISDELKGVLVAGVSQGAPASKIIEHMNSLKTNYKTIARTEINTAASEGSFLLANKELSELGLSGMALKGWQTASDEKVRDTHIDAENNYGEGKEIPFEEEFVVGGERMMFPADYSASAGEIINCRCNYYIRPYGLN